jgi:hypothetical protein
MQLEFHQLDLRYRELRVVDRERDARLLASLAGIGQKTPVLVVLVADDRYVLIDGAPQQYLWVPSGSGKSPSA